MNRQPSPEVEENQDKEPSFQELINIEVCPFELEKSGDFLLCCWLLKLLRCMICYS